LPFATGFGGRATTEKRRARLTAVDHVCVATADRSACHLQVRKPP